MLSYDNVEVTYNATISDKTQNLALIHLLNFWASIKGHSLRIVCRFVSLQLHET